MIQVYIYDWENPGYIRFRLDLDFRFSILLGKKIGRASCRERV